MAWLTDYLYRKTITVNNAGALLTNYQMPVKVYYGSGADGTETVEGVVAGKAYCGSRCQTDFDDIRFTNSDGETLLDQWLESKTDSNNAIYWVELDSVANGNNTFYMYFGNAGAAQSTSGANTFLLFDNFERLSDGDTIGGDWTETAAHVHISTDQAYKGTRSAKLVGAAGVFPQATVPYTAAGGVAIRFRVYKETAVDWFLPISHGNGTKRIAIRMDVSENILYYTGSAWVDTGSNMSADTWTLFEINNIDFTAGTYDIWYGGSSIKSGAAMQVDAVTTDVIRIYGDGITAGVNSWVDNYIVRNWVATPPTFTAWVTSTEPSLTDGITVGDTNAFGKVYEQSLTDGITVGDTNSVFLTFYHALTDGITVGDTTGWKAALYKVIGRLLRFVFIRSRAEQYAEVKGRTKSDSKVIGVAK